MSTTNRGFYKKKTGEYREFKKKSMKIRVFRKKFSRTKRGFLKDILYGQIVTFLKLKNTGSLLFFQRTNRRYYKPKNRAFFKGQSWIFKGQIMDL